MADREQPPIPQPSVEALTLVSERTAHKLGILPITFHNKILTIALANGNEKAADTILDDLRQKGTDIKAVNFVPALQQQIMEAISTNYSAPADPNERFEPDW